MRFRVLKIPYMNGIDLMLFRGVNKNWKLRRQESVISLHFRKHILQFFWECTLYGVPEPDDSERIFVRFVGVEETMSLGSP